jgi:hypothetical protein
MVRMAFVLLAALPDAGAQDEVRNLVLERAR